MEDFHAQFERGHQPHENRFIKVPGADAPDSWRPRRLGSGTGALVAALAAGGLGGALIYALLHGH